MTFTFDVANQWKPLVPKVVHEDGAARAHVVTRNVNLRYCALIEALEELAGNGVILNALPNRRGKPMVGSPTGALDILVGSELQYPMMEDILVRKQA